MQHLHQRQHLNTGDIVVVDCSHQCNVMLLTDSNYSLYKRGQGYKYCGGFYKQLICRYLSS
ncbi:MAG: DUF1883 domain-containing protein [Enterobacteriaceae bacterium]